MSTAVLESMQGSLQTEIPKFDLLEDRYRCEICKNVLQVPMMTLCGHRMCNACAKNLIEKNEGRPVDCPASLEDCMPFTNDTLVPDFGTFRDIQKLKVYCPNNRHGCMELLPWGKLQDHKDKCSYALEDCINKGFGCKAKVSKARMSEHLENECQFQTKRCQHCETRIPEKLMEDHLQNSCPAVSIICPFKCGEQSIQRGELEEHRKVCQAKPKDCRFKDIGCKFMGTDEDVRIHEVRDNNKHTEKLLERVITLEQENSNLRSMIQVSQGGATAKPPADSAQVTNLQQKCDVLEKKQERQENSLKNTQKMVASMNERIENVGPGAPTQKDITSLRDTVKNVEKSMDRYKNTSDDSRQQIVQMERTLGMCNMRLQEMDLRLQCVETASYNGVLLWKIRDFKRRKAEAVSGRTVSLYSQPFYTSRYGYKACARIYLNGDGMGKGNHMSLFFVILRGDFDALLQWPFRQKVTMTLIDQDGGKKNIVDSFRADPTSNSFKKPTSDMNIASGCPLFAKQSVVEAAPFLKDDCIFLKIQVDVSDIKDASYDFKSGSY